MNIDDLTLKQIKELNALLLGSTEQAVACKGLNKFVGQKVIVRTHYAGVHYGLLEEKDGKEVILKNARRLYYWKTTDKGISLSEVAKTGLHSNSKVCASVDYFWTEAIEIIPCTNESITSIEGQNEYKA